jgi:SSXT protein (N-terminal region)
LKADGFLSVCVRGEGESEGDNEKTDHPHPSSQFLEDNDRLIKAVQQCFAAGRLDDAARYSERLHANLTWLAAVADAAPGAPPPAG